MQQQSLLIQEGSSFQKYSCQNRSILDPYRTLGCFISGKINLSLTQPYCISVPTNNSYKIYSNNLTIKVLSPPLNYQIQSVITFNQYSYVKCHNKIIKFKYHHVVKQWQLWNQNQRKNNNNKLTKAKNKLQRKQDQNIKPNSILMKFDSLILCGQGNKVFIIDQKQQSLNKAQIFQISQNFIGMIHPVTYINKLIVYGHNFIKLINPISSKTLYDYPNLTKYLEQTQTSISVIKQSKLVNIIAISLKNGQILIFNIKKDEIVFKFKLKLPAISITFYDQQSLMVTSDELGNVVLWDLENKKILYKFQQFIQGAIDSLIFIPGQPVITCGSSVKNCIKQLRINFQDNRVLTLYRERNGITQPIQKINLLNNHQLTLSSKTQSLFTSLYSHTNNYKLNKVLDSNEKLHIISKHFNIQLFKNQTLQKTFNIHESAIVGKISKSQKYFIVGTRTRLIKLGAQQVQAKISGIKDIQLFNQHFIYVFTQSQILVIDFITFKLIKEIETGGKCTNSVVNQFKNFVSFYNHSAKSIQIYDMQRMQLARQYKVNTDFNNLKSEQQQNNQPILCLCFTSDNKYLLSSHSNKQLKIWSIIHNNLFKSFKLSNNILNMSFTQDNQYFLSVFENMKEINIWNNYIGKLLSNRQEQQLKFHVKINRFEQDFRVILKNLQINQIQIKRQESNIEQTNKQQIESILDLISNSSDQIPQYKFQFTSKWLPLIFYDQIKQRNTIEDKKQVSLPFFLDFKNIDQEKKKIQKQITQDKINKKKENQQKIDKHLKDNNHQIILNSDSTQEDYVRCVKVLQKLSIAQIDYQLRTFMLNPQNNKYILNMIEHFMNKQSYINNKDSISQEFKNIIIHRILYLIGTQIFNQQYKHSLKNISINYKEIVQIQKIKVDKCIAFTEKAM